MFTQKIQLFLSIRFAEIPSPEKKSFTLINDWISKNDIK